MLSFHFVLKQSYCYFLPRNLSLHIHVRRQYETNRIEKWIWITKPGHETLLAKELQNVGSIHVLSLGEKMGWVDCEVKDRYDATWGIQSIPNYTEIRNDSVSKLTKQTIEYLIPLLNTLESTKTLWGMHCIGDLNSQGRCKLIGQSFIEYLQRKRRHIFRLMQKNTLLEPGNYLIQLFMKDKTTLCISFSELSVSCLGWNRPFPWPKGKPTLIHSKQPPATSYLKLEELFKLMRIDSLKNQTVVELGSYPGGWTWSLLNRGAIVEAIDRVPFDSPALLSHPNLSHQTADAKKWLPKSGKCYEWLFSDLSLPPPTSLIVLENWVQQQLMKRFVYTLKFVGDEMKIDILTECKRLFQKYPNYTYCTRHLYQHGNEICVIGRLKKRE